MEKEQNQAREQPKPREGGKGSDLQGPGKRGGWRPALEHPGHCSAAGEKADESGLDRSRAVEKERGPVPTAGG